MEPEQNVIERVERLRMNSLLYNLNEFQRDALKIVCELAHEALAKRNQPSIAEVLDELEENYVYREWWSGSILQADIKKLRAKYCPAPEPKEKPTLRGVLELVLTSLCHCRADDVDWVTILEQFKEVE